MAAKNKKSKRPLTLKQARLVKALTTSDTLTAAAKEAGYHDAATAHRALRNTIAEKMPNVLRRHGLTEDWAAKKCQSLAEAKRKQYFANGGIVMDTREDDDHAVQLRALDLWGKFMGLYITREGDGGNGNGERNQSGGHSLSLVFTSEGAAREFIEAITVRRSASQPIELDARVDPNLG